VTAVQSNRSIFDPRDWGGSLVADADEA